VHVLVVTAEAELCLPANQEARNRAHRFQVRISLRDNER